MPHCSCYINNAFNKLKRPQILRELAKRIRESKLKYDVIACRGISGASVAPIVADRLKKPFAIVRKREEISHRHEIIESSVEEEVTNYIIIDDQIVSGNTIKEIVSEMKEINKDKSLLIPKCVGIFLYQRNPFHDACYDFNRVRIPVYYIDSQKQWDDLKGIGVSLQPKNEVKTASTSA